MSSGHRLGRISDKALWKGVDSCSPSSYNYNCPMSALQLRRFCDPGPLKSLHPVLKKWCHLMETRWPDWVNNDAPWWYNERASLSVFAGAVWQSNGLAFEEHSARKGVGRHDHAGRSDIWFRVGTTAFAGEAKQCWTKVFHTQKAVQRVIDHLESAKQDAHSVASSAIPSKGAMRIGLVFAAVQVPKRRASESETMIENFLRLLRLQRELHGSAIAWSFPASRRRLRDDYYGYYYPGCVLVIRRLRNVR